MRAAALGHQQPATSLTLGRLLPRAFPSFKKQHRDRLSAATSCRSWDDFNLVNFPAVFVDQLDRMFHAIIVISLADTYSFEDKESEVSIDTLLGESEFMTLGRTLVRPARSRANVPEVLCQQDWSQAR